MPRISNLVFSQAQEQETVDYCLQRVRELRGDNDDLSKADLASWKAYENDAKHRSSNTDTIFSLKNLHLPLTALVVEHFMARADEEIAGDRPYFHFEPIGKNDDETAREFNGYFNWKLDDKGGVHRVIKDAMLPIFIQRAHILKSTFVEEVEDWVDRDRRILVDRATQRPVNIPGRGPIIEGEDEFIDQPDPAAVPPADAEATGWQPPVRKHLKADPSFILNEKQHTWVKPSGLKRSEVLYRGAKSVPVDYDAFLCPSNVANIEEADMTAETYDKDLGWMGKMWLERPWDNWANANRAFEMGDAKPKTETERNQQSKENLHFDQKNPKRKVIECWVKRDVLGTGTPQKFVIFIDEESKKAVFYEYQAKVCPDFKRPYQSISVGRTKYWWGFSIPEKVAQYQEEADKQFNGELYRNNIAANPFTGGDPTALEEEPEGRIDSYPGKYHKTKPNRTLDEAIQVISLPDLDTKTQQILEFIIYMVQLWLGVSSIAQGDYSDTPSDSTAYGIEKTINEASKINKRWIKRIIADIEEHLTKLVLIEYATMGDNLAEVFNYADGDKTRVATMTAQKLRNVQVNVRLVLSQNEDTKTIERARVAMEVQDSYFTIADPIMREAKRPLLKLILESLNFKDTDKLLPPLPTVIPGPGGQILAMPDAGSGGAPAAAGAGGAS